MRVRKQIAGLNILLKDSKRRPSNNEEPLYLKVSLGTFEIRTCGDLLYKPLTSVFLISGSE